MYVSWSVSHCTSVFVSTLSRGFDHRFSSTSQWIELAKDLGNILLVWQIQAWHWTLQASSMARRRGIVWEEPIVNLHLHVEKISSVGLQQGKRRMGVNTRSQWWANLALPGHFPAEICSNPDTTHLPCSLLVVLKTMISWLRCVWLGLELNSEGKWPEGPETVIALSAVARNAGPVALILPWGLLKITFTPPRQHRSGHLSTAGLSNSPPSLGLPHPDIWMVFLSFSSTIL